MYLTFEFKNKPPANRSLGKKKNKNRKIDMFSCTRNWANKMESSLDFNSTFGW